VSNGSLAVSTTLKTGQISSPLVCRPRAHGRREAAAAGFRLAREQGADVRLEGDDVFVRSSPPILA
jgi:hypothetical protein